MSERDFKGVWIPKELWFDNNLGWSAKLLLVEIDSLSTNGECFATNEHFAEFFSLSKDRISKLISELKAKGYVEVKLIYKAGTKQIDKRIITTYGYRQKCLYLSVKTPIPIGENTYTPIGENTYTPIGENTEDNNTIVNNTIISNTTNNMNIIEPVGKFEEFWSAYPRQAHRFLTEQEYARSIMRGIQEEWLVEAAREYSLCMNGVPKQYIKNPENWLKENLYLDYPPGTYEKRKKELEQSGGTNNGNTGTNIRTYEESQDMLSRYFRGQQGQCGVSNM